MKTTAEELARKCVDKLPEYLSAHSPYAKEDIYTTIIFTVPLTELLEVARAAQVNHCFSDNESAVLRTLARLDLAKSLQKLQQKGIEL